MSNRRKSGEGRAKARRKNPRAMHTVRWRGERATRQRSGAKAMPVLFFHAHLLLRASLSENMVYVSSLVEYGNMIRGSGMR